MYNLGYQFNPDEELSLEQIMRLQKDVEDVSRKYGKAMSWSMVHYFEGEACTFCSLAHQGFNHFSFEVSILFYRHDPVFIYIDDPDEKLVRELLLNLLQWGPSLIECITVQNLLTGLPWWVINPGNNH